MDLGVNIKDLAKMFKELEVGQEDDSDGDNPKPLVKGPGDIALKPQQTSITKEASSAPKSTSKVRSGDIWELKEVGTKENGTKDDTDFIKHDPRQSPNYEMHYLQSVTTEDVFLQMGSKTPGTASCENLVVTVHLPKDDLQNIKLNLKKQAIDLRSPIHFLYLNLPHPIDPCAGNAKWDKETEKLAITLKLQREWDEYNF